MKGARILSSESDASIKIKQDQNTNVRLTIEHAPSNGNLTAMQTEPTTVHYPGPEEVQQQMERDIDLTADIAQKEKQIEILELLLQIYEHNPLIVNSLVVCKAQDLMQLIKLITDAEKVEIMLDADKTCQCSQSKFSYIESIFVTKDGKSVDFKYGFNDKYTLLVKHAISLKVVV